MTNHRILGSPSAKICPGLNHWKLLVVKKDPNQQWEFQPGSPLSSLCWAPLLWLDPTHCVGNSYSSAFLSTFRVKNSIFIQDSSSSPVIKTPRSWGEAVVDKWFALPSTICYNWCPPVPLITYYEVKTRILICWREQYEPTWPLSPPPP